MLKTHEGMGITSPRPLPRFVAEREKNEHLTAHGPANFPSSLQSKASQESQLVEADIFSCRVLPPYFG
jgi:hypothetical protein